MVILEHKDTHNDIEDISRELTETKDLLGSILDKVEDIQIDIKKLRDVHQNRIKKPL